MMLRQMIVAETCRDALEEQDNVKYVEPLGHESDFQPGEYDMVVRYEDGVEYAVFVRPILSGPPPRPQNAPTGVNPITIRPSNTQHPSLTISRMHVGIGDTEVHSKLVTAALVDEIATEVLHHTILDEDVFIDALQHLFPHGELEVKNG
jgi:hypothetical protein